VPVKLIIMTQHPDKLTGRYNQSSMWVFTDHNKTAYLQVIQVLGKIAASRPKFINFWDFQKIYVVRSRGYNKCVLFTQRHSSHKVARYS
jgi:hypothetical protein